MDKVLSARVDEVVLRQLGVLAHKLGTTKKEVLERAVRTLADQVGGGEPVDVLEQTCGAWARGEDAVMLVERSRKAFRKGIERHRS